jgi:putative DNA primase/helicase
MSEDYTTYERYSPEVREKIQSLNKADRNILVEFCTGTGTSNTLALHAACVMKRAGVSEEMALEELEPLYAMSYPDDSRGLSREIHRAYHPNENGSFKTNPRIKKPTDDQVRENLTKVSESDIKPLEIQPDLAGKPMKEVLKALYGNDHEVLVCLAKSAQTSRTRPLGEWLELSDDELKKYPLRCTQPMRALEGLNKSGKPSVRCIDNAAESMDEITWECDLDGVTEEHSLKVIGYLAQVLPPISVCRSAHVSTHAVLSLHGLSDELKRAVKNCLAEVGGDTNVMNGTYQLVRTPNAIRNDKKVKNGDQTFLYFNPENRGKEVDLGKLHLIGLDAAFDDTVRTEVAESELFEEYLGQDFLFVEEKGWLRWSGNHWEQVSNGALLNEAKRFQKASEQRGEEKRSFALGRKNVLQNIVDLTKVSISPELKVEKFDSDSMMLGVANGTLDLRQGVDGFRAAKQGDLISRVSEIEFDPLALCPVWDSFIERIFRTHPEVALYIQRLSGYCLTGDVREQIFAFFFGGGSNGKSTFIKTIETILGAYAAKLPKAAYLATRNGRPDTALSHLEHARLAVGDELNEMETLTEGSIKTFSGGDRLQARRFHCMEFNFMPTHKFIMFGNHKPVIHGNDDGIWRRVHFVPFVEKITDDEKDLELDKRLLKELPGILNWMLRGTSDWLKQGLKPPQVMVTAADGYRVEQDVIQQFIDGNLDLEDQTKRTARDEIYNSYKWWCQSEGASAKTKKNFLNAFRQKDIREIKRQFCCSILVPRGGEFDVLGDDETRGNYGECF